MWCAYNLYNIISIIIIIIIMTYIYRIWDYGVSSEPRHSHQNHSDYVYGLDMSADQDGLMADCGWDAETRVFRV
jgi:hypothetical protein